jgi:predicted dinucleotide-binding enzyme
MKIAMIGAGNVGGALGRAWAGKGHQVTYARPGDPKSACHLGPRRSAGRSMAGRDGRRCGRASARRE